MTKIEKIYPEQSCDTEITPTPFIAKATDEPEAMDWHEAMVAFDNNPDSEWRLPTRSELLIMYMNKEEIGGFDNDCYWSSSENYNRDAWIQHFSGDGNQSRGFKNNLHLVRLVMKG